MEAPAEESWVHVLKKLEAGQRQGNQYSHKDHVAGCPCFDSKGDPGPHQKEQGDGDNASRGEVAFVTGKPHITRENRLTRQVIDTQQYQDETGERVCPNQKGARNNLRKGQYLHQSMSPRPVPKKEISRWWDHNERNKQRPQKSKGLGVGQRRKQFSFRGLEGKHGQKTHNRRQDCGAHRPGNLDGCFIDDLQTALTGRGGVEVEENILTQDNTHIDHRANSNRNAGERHNIGRHVKRLHQAKSNQDSQGKHQSNQEGAHQVEDHDDHHDDGHEDFFRQRGPERPERLKNQSGPVIEGHDREF